MSTGEYYINELKTPSTGNADFLVWIEIYLDKFTSKTFRNRNTLGVYLSYSNVLRKVKGFSDFTDVIMLVPPGVDLYEVFAYLRRDLRLLAEGVSFYDAIDKRIKKLKALVSFLPTDLPQLSSTARHGGCTSSLARVISIEIFLKISKSCYKSP